jgi:hypothetical protein
MEYSDLFEVFLQVLAFVGPEDTKGQADEGPQVNHTVIGAVMFAQFMDLGMAVVAGGDTIIRLGCLDLPVLDLPVLESFFLEPGLQEAATAAAAEVVRAVGVHVDEVFFADHGFDHEAQVFGNRVPVALTDDLAGVLDREFDLQVLVPVGTDLQFAFADPFCIVFIDAFDFKRVCDVEFFQSGPD